MKHKSGVWLKIEWNMEWTRILSDYQKQTSEWKREKAISIRIDE